MSGERIEGWGLFSTPGREVLGEDLGAITRGVSLTRGLGRSYGDSSLPASAGSTVAGTVLADRILGFDEASGLLHAEAGLSLYEINRIFLKRGWFVPVTPGTQFVTLGGMVASDVHGKNHHREGCFGEHVSRLRMRLADDSIVECGPDDRAELFDATIGGMGLTGHILEVSFTMRRIPSPWILQESSRIPDIEAFVEALKKAGPEWPMTVGWIDCVSGGSNLGRGILMRGRWAEPVEAPSRFPAQPPRLAMPFYLPSWLLNPLSVLAFNTLFYWKHLRREKRGIVSPWSFFYPLDAILHWNRMYGRQGFTQYQCVLPDDAGSQAARRFLELLTRVGGASFLCVIKDCGPEGRGMLSFPRPGISIALDIPMRHWTQGVVDQLNAFVIAEGGRIYLTKDTLSRPEDFASMEPRLNRFQAFRRALDPGLRIRSHQSVRLLGDDPPDQGSP
jgi:decaprenylphospho-beta-D-ribofuranose 2-oxidase